MKQLRKFATLILLAGLMSVLSGCVVFLKEDTRKRPVHHEHQGWFLSTDSHKHSSSNPGRSRENEGENKHSEKHHKD
jgi:hypothetical protein